MAQKPATYMTFGTDESDQEILKYIKEAGVSLIVRDIKEQPLSVEELDTLFGHNPLTYFINQAADEYSKLGLDKKVPERAEMLKLLAEHPELLRHPIIKTVRLLTVGSNKDMIAQILQINRNGDKSSEVANGNRSGRIHRRSLPSRK